MSEVDVEALLQRWKEMDIEEEQFRLKKFQEREERKKLFSKGDERRRERITELIDELNNYNPWRLHYWMKHDTWTVPEGIVILCGYDPSKLEVDESLNIFNPPYSGWEPVYPRNLQNICLNETALEVILGKKRIVKIKNTFKFRYERLLTLWKSGNHEGTRFEPAYFIKWAVNKKMEPMWLEWVKNEGYFIDENDSVISQLKNSEKPLSTTERNTFLSIIAALCDYSDIKHQERGAAGQIAKLTEEVGAPVTDDTIRKILKQIPDVLETRMK